MDKNTFKLIYGLLIAALFLLLGFHLIKKEDTFAIGVGYANIFFWSGLILFTFYKLATKKQ